MIKNIETMTAKEFLRNQVKKGMTPTCPIRAGVKINVTKSNPTTSKNKKET